VPSCTGSRLRPNSYVFPLGNQDLCIPTAEPIPTMQLCLLTTALLHPSFQNTKEVLMNSPTPIPSPVIPSQLLSTAYSYASSQNSLESCPDTFLLNPIHSGYDSTSPYHFDLYHPTLSHHWLCVCSTLEVSSSLPILNTIHLYMTTSKRSSNSDTPLRSRLAFPSACLISL
jgi:hypothetical protein